MQAYHNLQQGNYSVRVKYLYNNSYRYTDAIGFGAFSWPTPFILADSSDALVSSASTNNQWYFNGTAIPGATGQRYMPVNTGHYTVMVGSDSCHSNMSLPFNFVAEHLGVSLFPNPAGSYVYLNNTRNRLLVFQVMGMDGRVLTSGNLPNGKLKLPLGNFTAGTYFINIKDQKTNAGTMIKFIKDH
jgi:hypothetical protein